MLMEESGFGYMNINCKIPSTFPYVGNFHKMSEKNPKGLPAVLAVKGKL